MLRAQRLLLIALLFGAGQSVWAIPVTLTMDDFPPQVLDGFSHPAGIDFSVNVLSPGSPVRYNVAAVGTTAFVDGPGIEGSSFVQVTFDFADPTGIFAFGFARNTMDAVTTGVQVLLYDAANALLDTVNVDAGDNGFGWAEGQYTYGGATAIARAVLDFNLATAGPGMAAGDRFIVVVMLNHTDVHRGPGHEVQEMLLRWLYRQ